MVCPSSSKLCNITARGGKNDRFHLSTTKTMCSGIQLPSNPACIMLLTTAEKIPMRIDVLTLFPAMFEGPMTESMLWKARDRNLLDLRLHDIRDYTTDKHHTADDIPYGGGGGMIMKAEPVAKAVEDALKDAPAGTPVILMTPQGRVFSHAIAKELAQYPQIVLVCGRYEGI